MAKKINFHQEGEGKAQLNNFQLYPVAADPPAPANGVAWVNTVTGELKFRAGGTSKTTLTDENFGIYNPKHIGTSPPADLTKTWKNTNPGKEGLYEYDTVRLKWLSPEQPYQYGEDGADNQYLATAGINGAGTPTGYYLLGEWTITQAVAYCRDSNDSSKILEIRSRVLGNNPNILEAQFTTNQEASNDMHFGAVTNLNIDIDNKVLSVFADGSGQRYADINVVLYVCRRG